MIRPVGSLALIVCLLCAATASAQSAAVEHARAQALAQESARAEAQAVQVEKDRLAGEILRLREQAGGREPFDERFTRYWKQRLRQLSIAQLEALLAAGGTGDLTEVFVEASGAMAADAVAADFGDSNRDLVFTKVTPCRIVDTRGTAQGGIPNGGGRSFYVAGNTAGLFAGQGGAPCGVPVGATAVAANLTVAGTAGYGWLRAFPYGGTGNASVINYNGTADLANGLILPICDPASATCAYDLTVVADAAGTHVLIDVMGYFMKPSRLGTLRTVSVTSQTASSLALPEFGACANYHQVQVTAPGPGQILVSAKFQLRMQHTQGTDNEVWAGISEVGPATCTGVGFAFGYGTWQLVPGALPSTTYYPWDTATLKFDAPAAGTYVFYLNGKKTLGGPSTGAFHFGAMTATFNPL